MNKKLLCVGAVAFDAIETPFEKTDKILGGAATYIALAASHFDIDFSVVSVVGCDFPDTYLTLLKNRSINTDGIEIVPDGKTFFWRGRYRDNMNYRDTLETKLNVLEHFKPVVPVDYTNASVVMLGNLHPFVQLSVLEQMSEKPALSVLDTMDFWMDVALDDLKMVLKRVDVVSINDQEARHLSGCYSLVDAARAIQKMGPTYIIIKKGEHGALLFYKDEIFSAPALPLQNVKDPTGAGDTFAGGFVGYLCQTGDFSFENMKTAMIHASVFASFCVEEFGTKALEKIADTDLKERIKQFKKLTQYQL